LSTASIENSAGALPGNCRLARSAQARPYPRGCGSVGRPLRSRPTDPHRTEGLFRPRAEHDARKPKGVFIAVVPNRAWGTSPGPLRITRFALPGLNRGEKRATLGARPYPTSWNERIQLPRPYCCARLRLTSWLGQHGAEKLAGGVGAPGVEHFHIVGALKRGGVSDILLAHTALHLHYRSILPLRHPR